MITKEAVDAYNSRITATVSQLDRLSTVQKDQIKSHGSRAEALLANHDLVMFMHQFRFEVTDTMAGIPGHDPDSNARRVALANQLTGLDQFIATLQRAVYMKNRVVSSGEGPRETPRDSTKEVFTP